MKNNILTKISGFMIILSIFISPVFSNTALAHKENRKEKNCIPRGIIHAKGIDKRIENGKGFPKGIVKKIVKCEKKNNHENRHDDRHDNKGNHHATTTATTTPQIDTKIPNILHITNVETLASSTRLIWITDERSDSKVWISTNSNVDISVLPTASSSSLVYFHDIKLNDLSTSTKYYYTLVSSDSSGNKATSTGNFFQTLVQ